MNKADSHSGKTRSEKFQHRTDNSQKAKQPSDTLHSAVDPNELTRLLNSYLKQEDERLKRGLPRPARKFVAPEDLTPPSWPQEESPSNDASNSGFNPAFTPNVLDRSLAFHQQQKSTVRDLRKRSRLAAKLAPIKITKSTPTIEITSSAVPHSAPINGTFGDDALSQSEAQDSLPSSEDHSRPLSYVPVSAAHGLLNTSTPDAVQRSSVHILSKGVVDIYKKSPQVTPGETIAAGDDFFSCRPARSGAGAPRNTQLLSPTFMPLKSPGQESFASQDSVPTTPRNRTWHPRVFTRSANPRTDALDKLAGRNNFQDTAIMADAAAQERNRRRKSLGAAKERNDGKALKSGESNSRKMSPTNDDQPDARAPLRQTKVREQRRPNWAQDDDDGSERKSGLLTRLRRRTLGDKDHERELQAVREAAKKEELKLKQLAMREKAMSGVKKATSEVKRPTIDRQTTHPLTRPSKSTATSQSRPTTARHPKALPLPQALPRPKTADNARPPLTESTSYPGPAPQVTSIRSSPERQPTLPTLQLEPNTAPQIQLHLSNTFDFDTKKPQEEMESPFYGAKAMPILPSLPMTPLSPVEMDFPTRRESLLSPRAAAFSSVPSLPMSPLFPVDLRFPLPPSLTTSASQSNAPNSPQLSDPGSLSKPQTIRKPSIPYSEPGQTASKRQSRLHEEEKTELVFASEEIDPIPSVTQVSKVISSSIANQQTLQQHSRTTSLLTSAVQNVAIPTSPTATSASQSASTTNTNSFVSSATSVSSPPIMSISESPKPRVIYHNHSAAPSEPPAPPFNVGGVIRATPSVTISNSELSHMTEQSRALLRQQQETLRLRRNTAVEPPLVDLVSAQQPSQQEELEKAEKKSRPAMITVDSKLNIAEPVSAFDDDSPPPTASPLRARSKSITFRRARHTRIGDTTELPSPTGFGPNSTKRGRTKEKNKDTTSPTKSMFRSPSVPQQRTQPHEEHFFAMPPPLDAMNDAGPGKIYSTASSRGVSRTRGTHTPIDISAYENLPQPAFPRSPTFGQSQSAMGSMPNLHHGKMLDAGPREVAGRGYLVDEEDVEWRAGDDKKRYDKKSFWKVWRLV